MKERSLVERIVAILGVLLGTIAWVVRLLFSLVKGLLSGGSGTKQGEVDTGGTRVSETAKTYATDLKQKSGSLIEEAREKGGALLEDVKEKGEDLVEEAREKIDEVTHRGEKDDEAREGDTGFGTAETVAGDRTGISDTQHDGIGGVPDTGAVAAASLSAMDSAFDERTSGSMDDDEETQLGTHVTEGIPNLEEPGEGDEADMYGSESGSLAGRDEETGYAGQAMSESDVGIDRGDSISGFADSEDREGGEFRGWVDDEVNVLQEEPTGEEYDSAWVEDQVDVVEAESGEQYDTSWVTDQINADDDEETDDDDDDEVPAASRGWEEPEDDVLKGDPLYSDVESSGTGGEVDLRNDEADEDDAAGMHIVDSPDEPYIEDEDASQSLGFASTGTEPPFDTTTNTVDVDEIGGEPVAVGEDQLAADALGHPAGGDAASGDLGPDESPDDATWAPGESRPDYDVLGARDGSGVDEFADDSVAESMLDDVTDDAASTEDESSSEAGSGSGTGTGSVAWATSSGVIDRDLAEPLSADELQSGGDATAETDEVSDAGTTEADAGLKDVAADVAQDLDQEMGDHTATGTTMSGAGQSAGAMTSEDATDTEEGGDGTLSDSGSVETGGEPAMDEEPPASGGETSDTEAGRTGGAGFDDVLPESEYAERVGYDTLQADEGNTGSDVFRGSFLTETSTSGVTPATSGTDDNAKPDRRRPAPSGSVRGDGSGTCPAGYPIKGNASSKIYHRPTDSSYESTIPEFCFATEEDARAAGFRARKG